MGGNQSMSFKANQKRESVLKIWWLICFNLVPIPSAVTQHQEKESTGAFGIWEFLKMKKSEKQQRFLFLTSEAATLQVTPVYRYTSTLNSTLRKFAHWPFDESRNMMNYA